MWGDVSGWSPGAVPGDRPLFQAVMAGSDSAGESPGSVRGTEAGNAAGGRAR